MSTFTYVGIDVSHLTLEYAISSEASKVLSIENKASSIRSWLLSLETKSACLVLEPTGTYHDQLIHIADELGIPFVMVSPRISYYYAKSQGHIHLNDSQAARSLARYAEERSLPPSHMPSDQQIQRKQLLRSLKSLKKQDRMLRNQIHAMSQHYRINPMAISTLEVTLGVVGEQIEKLEEQLHELESDEEAHLMELMQTVVGIGPKSAREILCYFGNFSTFEHDKQVLKFAGVVPAGHTSGSSVRKPEKITKQGPKTLRATLYIAARSAKKHNLACQQLYERMRQKGKPYKKAMVAVVAKLLRQVFAVVKSQQPFDNQYHLRFSKTLSN